MVNNNRTWSSRFMKLAKEVASWSKDPNTKVGAVVVNGDNQIVSCGYNGLPKGLQDLPERLTRDKGEKYLWVEHAERNALSQAQGRATGCTMYTTLYPCVDCMKGIIQAGISCVFVLNPEGPNDVFYVNYEDSKWSTAMRIVPQMANEANVPVYFLYP